MDTENNTEEVEEEIIQNIKYIQQPKNEVSISDEKGRTIAISSNTDSVESLINNAFAIKQNFFDYNNKLNGGGIG